jgi:hypothetical protein
LKETADGSGPPTALDVGKPAPLSRSPALIQGTRPRARRAVRKGKHNETRCAKELKAQGYKTWQTMRCRFRNLDLFELFDVLALDRDAAHLRFIQVKSGRCDAATKRAVGAFKLPSGCTKEIWIYIDRKGWKKEVIA